MKSTSGGKEKGSRCLKGDWLKNCPASVPRGPNQGMSLNYIQIYCMFGKTGADFARMLLDTQCQTGQAVGCPVPLLTHLGQGLLKKKVRFSAHFTPSECF